MDDEGFEALHDRYSKANFAIVPGSVPVEIEANWKHERRVRKAQRYEMSDAKGWDLRNAMRCSQIVECPRLQSFKI